MDLFSFLNVHGNKMQNKIISAKTFKLPKPCASMSHLVLVLFLIGGGTGGEFFTSIVKRSNCKSKTKCKSLSTLKWKAPYHNLHFKNDNLPFYLFTCFCGLERDLHL